MIVEMIAEMITGGIAEMIYLGEVSQWDVTFVNFCLGRFYWGH